MSKSTKHGRVVRRKRTATKPTSDVDVALAELQSDEVARRRAGALALGRSGTTAQSAVPALIEALRCSDDTKLRKNAGIALGKIGDEGAIEPLASAVSAEEMNWVRPSLILALGAIGGEAALAALDAIEPLTDDDSQALRRARSRTSTTRPTARWSKSPTDHTLARVPDGLEAVAMADFRESGRSVESVSRGLLRIDVSPPDLDLAEYRCVQQQWVPLAAVVRPARGAVSSWPQGRLETLVEDLLGRADALWDWCHWIDTTARELPVRFFLLLGRGGRRELKRVADAARGILGEHDIVDEPSSYLAELGLVARGNEVLLVMKPSFIADDRFSYRRTDVGASIQPTVAAALARLAGPPCGGLVIDPTCGSSTLLIERGLYDPGATLRAIDVSPTAVRASNTNLEAAGMSSRATVVRGDSADQALWKPARVILANLPFGVRSRSEKTSLRGLYRRLVSNVSKFLLPGGTAVLYSGASQLLDSALARAWKGAVPQRLQARVGGIEVSIRVLCK